MKLLRFLASLFLISIAWTLAGGALLYHPDTPLPDAWNPLRPLDPTAKVTAITGWKLRRTIANPTACLAALSASGAAFNKMPDKTDSALCGIPNRVIVTKMSEAAMAPLDTRCGTALRVLMWERHSLQPAARQMLGSPVIRIGRFGSYSCRPIAGSANMSEHATANAVDVAGFRLDDGRL